MLCRQGSVLIVHNVKKLFFSGKNKCLKNLKWDKSNNYWIVNQSIKNIVRLDVPSHILWLIVGLQGGPWPEANAVRGPMAGKV